MNRKSLTRTGLGVLLMLWPFVRAGAQSARLEYWFDQYGDPSTIGMPSAAGTLTAKIDVSSLAQGFHTIYMRVKANNEYSPVTSASFMKFTTTGSGESVLEYWFDQDFKNKATMPISVTSDAEQVLQLDLADDERFPMGVHRLNMRVVAYGGQYSPIYSDYVLRMPVSTGESVLEYWFDDNYRQHATMKVADNNGMPQTLNLDLNNAVAFPYGLHRLNMRVAMGGSSYSPVYSSLVMRLPNGQTNELMYWLDDDYQHGRHVIKAKRIEGKDVLFDVALNLSSVAPGMHRFKYRIATNGFDDGVVYEVPVLITKRYNNQQWDVSVVGESRWVDEMASPVPLALSNPQSQITRSYVLNPDDYSNGQHVFYVQYKNSADVWSATNATYFYKEAATGRLVKGIMPDIEDDITDAEMSELMSCVYYNGTVIVDCQSPRLASEGKLIVCDLTGRVLAQEKVENINGIHAEVSIPGKARQLLVVKLVSGSVAFTKKLVGR